MKKINMVKITLIGILVSAVVGVMIYLNMSAVKTNNALYNACYGDNVLHASVGKIYVNKEVKEVSKKCKDTSSLDEVYTYIYEAMMQYRFCYDEISDNIYANGNIYDAIFSDEMVCRGFAEMGRAMWSGCGYDAETVIAYEKKNTTKQHAWTKVYAGDGDYIYIDYSEFAEIPGEYKYAVHNLPSSQDFDDNVKDYEEKYEIVGTLNGDTAHDKQTNDCYKKLVEAGIFLKNSNQNT